MKTKKYFNRIFAGVLCVCLAFSLVISFAYYFISTDRLASDFYYEKEKEAVVSTGELEKYIGSCTAAAEFIGEKISEYENGVTDKNLIFEEAEKICASGNVYVIGDTVIKKDDTPELVNKNLYDMAGNVSEDVHIFSFTDNNSEFAAIVNRVKKSDGSRIFVMRTIRENLFFEETDSDAVIIFGDGNPVYIGNKTARENIISSIEESGKQDILGKIERKEYRDGDFVYILRNAQYLQDGRIIFAYSDDYVDSLKIGVMLTCVAVFFIVFVISGLLCIIPAKIMYHPIDELVAFAGRYGEEKDKSDEVSYISGTMMALEEKNRLLTMDGEEKKELLKIQFVKDLLSGVVSETEYGELAEEFKMTEYETPFYVGIFEISDYENMLEAFGEKNLIQIKKQIGSFIGDELTGRCVSGAVEMDKKRFAVITCGCDLGRIRQNFSYIISVINSEFDVEMFSVISKECDSLFEIGEGYQMCAKTLEDSFAIGFRGGVVTAEDIDAGSGFYYPVNMERDLISSVIRLKREESLKIINSILDENLNGKTLTKERQNAIVFAFTATINRIVEALNKSIDEIYGEDNIIFLELKMCEGAGALRAKVVQSFDKIMNYMAGDEDADLSQRFLDYIHSHYNEDISLTELGNHFKRSESYISTIFKETTGENFKDYLSRYRIKKAKEILIKNPDIKTKELAAMIGCNTVATLFRLFNKYEGMSPGQFVKSNLKE